MYKRSGFTLIELLVTIGVMATALTAVSGILVAIVKVQQRQDVVLNINSYGAAVISAIEQVVRTNEGVSVDAVNGRLIYYDKDNLTKYLGIQTVSSGCGVQGYVYNSNKDVVNGEAIPDYDVVTDTSESDGVNVTALSFEETRTNPLWITATVTIEKAPCSATFDGDSSTTFTTTVRSLR